ncbi:DUF3265 domain-containing protein [Vibrio harveyi]|nr:DUF3265 domain-containing protein [Vibrio harveyi]
MIRHAWHFHHALVLVVKVVCVSFGIACLTLNRALCASSIIRGRALEL